MLGKINDTVHYVKNKKKETTEKLYTDFLNYLNVLEKEGLMNDGKFSLQDTVAYQKLVDKSTFTKPIEDTRYEKNPRKEHIEFGYGIGNFFASIGRAFKTRKEPETVKKVYINIEKYISENINPIEAEVDRYVEKLKADYKNDIVYLKDETKKKVDSVTKLIEEKNNEILRIESEAEKYVKDENKYRMQIQKLEKIENALCVLISKIKYTQV